MNLQFKNEEDKAEMCVFPTGLVCSMPLLLKLKLNATCVNMIVKQEKNGSNFYRRSLYGFENEEVTSI